MSPPRVPRALFALSAAALAAGCGGAAESGEPVATTEVRMVKSYRFVPATIRVSAGDTVTWVNDDGFTHTVQVEGREDVRVERGESVELTFAAPGVHRYVCTLHRRDMDGTVIVE